MTSLRKTPSNPVESGQARWRLIDSGACDAFYNMALDEAVSVFVRGGQCPPTLRFYSWDRPSLSIGCFQKTGGIDRDYLREKDIPLVRRPTGGRAILHAEELTYSFSSKTEGAFQAGILETYKKISSALGLALKALGIEPEMERTRKGSYSKSPFCFQSRSYGELSAASGGRKLAGSAQRRWQDGFLQQGSIPFEIDYEQLKKIFTDASASGDSGKAAGGPSAMDYRSLRDAVRESFENIFGVEFISSKPEEMEEELALELLSRKYLSPEWNFER